MSLASSSSSFQTSKSFYDWIELFPVYLIVYKGEEQGKNECMPYFFRIKS